MLSNKFIAIFILFISSSCALWAQEGVITVVDSKSGKPIEFVHLIFKDQTTQKQSVLTTDVKGQADNVAENVSDLIVSFVGYNPIHTVISPNQSITYKLVMGANGLDEVVVTGQYGPVSESNSVYKVKLLTSAQIESRGAITLNQLLNDQLNIRISQDNVLGSGIQMQGLGDNNVKILIDGVPVTGRLNGNIDLSQINLDNIERVEIIEGPMSVMYGSNALAGTINLITKKPKKNQKAAGAKFYYESVGVYNTDVFANMGTKNTTAKINIGRNFFDGWSPEKTNPEEGLRWQQWKLKEQYFGNAAIKRDFKNFSIGYMVDGLWEEIKDKGDRRSEFSNYAFDTYFTTNRLMNSLTADVKNIKNHKLKIIGSYTYYNRRNVKYNRNLVNLTQEITQNPTDHDTTIFNTVLLRPTISSNFEGKLNYQLGADINWEKTQGGRIDGTPEIGDYAAFGSLNWQATEKLVVQPGLRYAYNTQFAAPVVPSINFQYKQNENWQLRLSYAHGFRAPSLKEMYLYFVDVNHNIQGNPDLTPENSKHVHAYFSWNKKISKTHSIKIEPSLFYNHINNMINLTLEAGNLYTYLNIDQYTTFGGKIEVDYRIHPDFDFKVGYSHLGYSNQLQSDEETTPYLYTPEFNASFNYWRAQQRFRFNITYKYTGSVPNFVVGETGEAVQTKIPGYSLMDVTSSYGFWKNRFIVSVGAKNLFDVQNLNVLNGSGGTHSSGSFVVNWGRSYFVGLKFNI